MEASRSRSSSPSKSNRTSASDPPKAGSVECPYKLVIVGGGPAGCSVIVRALRIGLLSELCGFTFGVEKTDPKNNGTEEQKNNHHASSTPSSSSSSSPSFAGVCLIDSGPLQRFGGGRLQDYQINSNTYVNKFVSHVVEEKPDNLPPEKVKGTPLERLGRLFSAQELANIGNHVGPLKKVGAFLRDVGQTVYSILQSFPESSRSYHETTVQSIHRLTDDHGRFLHWKIIMKTITNVYIEVYAKHIVLCAGGHQEAPIFSNPQYRSKVMLSDHVCTSEGTHELKQRLLKNTTNISGMGRIVIIGGSHSAFSAAWICLNKLLDDEFAITPNTSSRSALLSPSHPAGSAASTAIANGNGNTTASAVPQQTQNSIGKLRFGTSGICILHRSTIKVFYSTKSEADHDNYHDYATYSINKITGQINPFGGIRGDAKELFKSIRTSRETRVRLLQMKGNIGIANSPSMNNNVSFGGMKQSIVDKVLEECVVIIWACGYSTNKIPIYDANNELIPIAHAKGQVSVDEQARVLAEDEYQFSGSQYYSSNDFKKSKNSNGNVIENLYGSGLGYGLKATFDNGELDGSSGRADGVAVYLKRSATLVLSHVLGNQVFGGGNIRSWEERNTLLRKQQLMQVQQQQQQQQHQNNLSSLSMGSTSSTVGTTSSTITAEKLHHHASAATLKALASPKRPSTTATSSTRSISSRHSYRVDKTTAAPTASTSSWSSGSSGKSGILHKSCPESFLKTATACGRSNNNTPSHQRPVTQHQRKSSQDMDKVAQDLRRPQSAGKARSGSNQPSSTQAPIAVTLMSSTTPLQVSTSPSKPSSPRSPFKLVSPVAESPQKSANPNLSITPVTTPSQATQLSQKLLSPQLASPPHKNHSNNNTSPRPASRAASVSSQQRTPIPLATVSINSLPDGMSSTPHNSNNNNNNNNSMINGSNSKQSPQQSPHSLPSTQKPMIITPLKSPTASNQQSSLLLPRSPHLPFPVVFSIDERKSLV